MSKDETAENETLRRISALLDIPVADFFAVPASTSASAEEVAALILAFRAVRDPRARRACIEALEAAAQGGRPKGPKRGDH